MNCGKEEIDSDTEWGDFDETSEVGSYRPLVESRTDSNIDEYPDINGMTNAREAMRKLPKAERLKIAEQVEVSKWNNQGNDVTRARGRLLCLYLL